MSETLQTAYQILNHLRFASNLFFIMITVWCIVFYFKLSEIAEILREIKKVLVKK